jgi:hypothetical protein
MTSPSSSPKGDSSFPPLIDIEQIDDGQGQYQHAFCNGTGFLDLMMQVVAQRIQNQPNEDGLLENVRAGKIKTNFTIENMNIRYNTLIEVFKTCNNLQEVSLSEITVDNQPMKDSQLQHLSGLTRLTAFNLSFLESVSEEVLDHIPKNAPLREVSLMSCSSITDRVTLHLVRFRNTIEKIGLSMIQFNDTSLMVLKKFPKLRELDLSDCEQVTDTTLAILQENCRALNSLDLSQAINNDLKNAEYHITDVGLKTISQMEALTELNIHGCKKVTNKGIKHLMSTPKLEVLISHIGYNVTEEAYKKCKFNCALTPIASIE